MIRTSFSSLISSHPFCRPARIYAPGDSRLAPMLLKKTRTFLSLLSRSGYSLSLSLSSLFSRLRDVSHVLSRNSFCEIHIAGFVRNARARARSDLRRSLSRLCAERFRADNARFPPTLFEIIAPFRYQCVIRGCLRPWQKYRFRFSQK